ncbi:MAG: hypothetical protein V4724_25895 [Pseudomonadota bacterium]
MKAADTRLVSQSGFSDGSRARPDKTMKQADYRRLPQFSNGVPIHPYKMAMKNNSTKIESRQNE